MKVISIIDEDLVNYKKISMNVLFPYCSLKCDKECGEAVCYNSPLLKEPIVEVNPAVLAARYMANPLNEAIVCIGMEPFDSWEDLQALVAAMRHRTDDDIVIYTGYYEREISEQIKWLKQYPNIIIKFGRYVPHKESKYNEILGVTLASPNQYAVKIS